MSTTPPDSSAPRVLIVGAGPVGLFLACLLRRHGIAFRIVEQEGGPCVEARATQIQARSLEMLAQEGLIEVFLAAGNVLTEGQLFGADGQLLKTIPFTQVASPYPFHLSIAQSRTERLLLDHLTGAGQIVEWNRRLVAFEQWEEGVLVLLRDQDGREERAAFDYLVACDGAHSRVREGLAMALRGSDYPATFTIADVEIEGPLPQDKITVYSAPQATTFFAPLADSRTLFVADVLDHQLAADKSVPSLEDLHEVLRVAGVEHFRIVDQPNWCGYFHCHRRLARHFRKGRVFLAGDAAHVQSPAGGLGLNTGWQDAANLAWKLALVVSGQAPEGLLKSYHAERRAVVKQSLKLSDQMHEAIFQRHDNFLERALRSLADFFAHHGLSHPEALTPDLTWVSYRDSKIVREDHGSAGGAAWAAAPQAGDRAPDGALFALSQGTPRHRLLLFHGAAGDPALEDLTRNHEALIETWTIESEDDPDGKLHQAYGVEGPCLYLIRPDGHIAYRSPTPDAAALGRYLAAVFHKT
ncbi:MAG: FAD-dependent monooxygenase [Pseudomonadota bacterium]